LKRRKIDEWIIEKCVNDITLFINNITLSVTRKVILKSINQ